MHSLYYLLTEQHRDEFAPMRCSEQTLSRLLGYFEDVVTENKLHPLVIEGRCLNGADPVRETKRLHALTEVSQRVYLFSCDSECPRRSWQCSSHSALTTLEERNDHQIETGPFILVMEARFCGLLASRVVPEEGNGNGQTYDMIWTFDPNVVFTAIEYLMARVSAQKPKERERFLMLVNFCTPHTSSLRFALAFTTKVTLMIQRQNELEMATNRISSAISNTLEIEQILQSAVEEVGRVLRARRAALVIWQEGSNVPEGMSIYERSGGGQEERSNGADTTLRLDPSDSLERLELAPGTSAANRAHIATPCSLEMPITYRNISIGGLLIEDDRALRNWEDEEVLMVKTVCDQLSVAISHARLFRLIQTQAMTDALTTLFNHRYLQERLDREMKLADRNNQQVSLILLDLDHLKHINDTLGHRSGDVTLCHVSSIMKDTVRDVDICARYGGEEFVIILPQCDRESAMKVAERLREAIASRPVPKVGRVTASIGVATYPTGAKSKEELIEMADRAMYLAKAAGRNRVRTLAHRNYSGIDVR
ncbi:MAG TPA: sensor domain-containing diguanylate cyclase [Blastocatellia bacterium]|nr:sensor domain-containing diguanylate cyclase [Blastocatellia bacterium]